MSGSFHHRLGYLALLILILLVGCAIIPTSDQSVQDTRTAIKVQQTQFFQQIQTSTAQQASASPTIQPSPTPPEQVPTQVVLTPDVTPSVDFQTWMKTAKILLYEDMIMFRDTNRYVKDTLDFMNLPYVDIGNAIGNLKSQILSKGPNGNGWDLVIIAAEAKPEIQGEFFAYLNDVLDQRTSLILEVWYLDKVAFGTASALLARCGVAFERDWQDVPPNGMVMFPLNPSHPMLREPNAGLTFTDVSSYWWDPVGPIEYDIGDQLKIGPGGDAELLIGTYLQDPNSHGTLAVCINGQFILQTFSSHQLTYNAMRPLWENYIYNALKARFKKGES